MTQETILNYTLYNTSQYCFNNFYTINYNPNELMLALLVLAFIVFVDVVLHVFGITWDEALRRMHGFYKRLQPKP